MAKIEIYTSALCGFCYRAKSILESKGVPYEETNVTLSPGKRAEMMKRAGSRSVPQIWIDGAHIGGSDELAALDASGELDAMLGSAA